MVGCAHVTITSTCVYECTRANEGEVPDHVGHILNGNSSERNKILTGTRQIVRVVSDGEFDKCLD